MCNMALRFKENNDNKRVDINQFMFSAIVVIC